MKSILEQIYFGNKFMIDKIPYRERSKKNFLKMRELEEDFKKILTKEQKEAFQRYTDEIVSLGADENASMYIEGVKIGILIGMEAAGVFDDES